MDGVCTEDESRNVRLSGLDIWVGGRKMVWSRGCHGG